MAWGAVLVGVVLVVAVGLPRFAFTRDIDEDDIGLTEQRDGWFMRHDDGRGHEELGRYSFDIYSYVASVSYYRGEFDRYPIFGPWRWRLLPSWIASKTPIDNPAVALGTVSLGFLAVGVASLVGAAASLGLRRRCQYLVAGLFALSFPMLWYGTSGYVDGAVVALLCLALLLIHRRQWLWFLLLIPAGMATKETFVIVVPVAVTYLWATGALPRRWISLGLAASTAVAATVVALRVGLPTPRTLDWIPRARRLSWNLSRPEAIVSFLLSCGIVVPLALVQSAELYLDRLAGRRARWRRHVHLVVGVFFGLLVALHGFLTAYADGRHVWTVYPWGVVLAGMLLDGALERRDQSNLVTSQVLVQATSAGSMAANRAARGSPATSFGSLAVRCSSVTGIPSRS